MNGNHPNNIDPRPKRRKDKYNPYEIFTVGIDTAQPHYYLSFTDGSHIRRCVEIDKALFEAFDRFELDDISQMNKMDRHYERSEQTEISLHVRALKPQAALEETVLQKVEFEDLYRAIAKLTETQRRRLILYYFYDLRYTKIAEMEGCRLESVRKCVQAAIGKLKKLLDKDL